MSTEMNSKPIRKNIVFIMFMLSYFFNKHLFPVCQ